MKTQTKYAIREWTETILTAVILALLIRTFVVQAFKIPTGSMRETLIEGDRILVNKFIYGARIPFTDFRLPALRQPQRGDIIVFKYPEDPKRDFIKRVIALGGETVEIKDGRIIINGKPVDEPYILLEKYYYNRGEFGQENSKVNVLENFYYVLGDNSANSTDSRYWGFVPKKNLVGKAFLVYWPINRIKIIK